MGMYWLISGAHPGDNSEQSSPAQLPGGDHHRQEAHSLRNDNILLIIQSLQKATTELVCFALLAGRRTMSGEDMRWQCQACLSMQSVILQFCTGNCMGSAVVYKDVQLASCILTSVLSGHDKPSLLLGMSGPFPYSACSLVCNLYQILLGIIKHCEQQPRPSFFEDTQQFDAVRRDLQYTKAQALSAGRAA